VTTLAASCSGLFYPPLSTYVQRKLF